MSFNFNFTTLQDERQLRTLIDFVAKQDLGYPNYPRWVEKAEHDLKTGQKSAILAFSDGALVADLIYQQHRTIPQVLEIKNLRVHPELRERYFARFMLKQLEREARGYTTLLTDARESQTDVLSFFLASNFSPVAILPIYSPESNEVIIAKPLTSQTSSAHRREV